MVKGEVIEFRNNILNRVYLSVGVGECGGWLGFVVLGKKAGGRSKGERLFYRGNIS